MNNFSGGMGEDGGFGGIDFSKLGAGAESGGEGGMPGMEGLGTDEGEGEGEDDEDEEMPGLEDEEEEGEKAEAGESSKAPSKA
jgi:hypothetical protein